MNEPTTSLSQWRRPLRQASSTNEATITFKGKELQILEWALEDLFHVEEKELEASKWQDKDQDQFCDRIFELLERVRKARNN